MTAVRVTPKEFKRLARLRPVKAPQEVFGLFDETMLPKLNRLLKPYGLRLILRHHRNWGDQALITVEALKK